MRYRVPLLFLMLLPVFAFGLCRKEVKESIQTAQAWEREMQARIDSAKETSDRSESLRLLGEAEGWCNSTMTKYDEIINGKRKHRHHQEWHDKKRTLAINEKKRLEGVRGEIEGARTVYSALKQGEPIYAEGERLAEQARALFDNCPRDFDSVDLCVSTLEEAGRLFDAAAAKASAAVEILFPVPGVQWQPWQETQIGWQKSATYCRNDALTWPTRVLQQRVETGGVKLLNTLRQYHEQQGHFEEAAKCAAALLARPLPETERAYVQERLDYYKSLAEAK